MFGRSTARAGRWDVVPAPEVALVHDYITQRGGAERVVLSLASAFPEAAIWTSLYDPVSSFPKFSELDVHTLRLNQLGIFARPSLFSVATAGPGFLATQD